MIEEILAMVRLILGFALDRLGDDGKDQLQAVLDDEARKRAEAQFTAARKAKFPDAP